MSLESIALGALAVVFLGSGYVCIVRVEMAPAFQEQAAEAISWRPPSEDPEYYKDTQEHRQGVFQLGGGVLLTVGALLLAVSIYGTFFVDSFPR